MPCDALQSQETFSSSGSCLHHGHELADLYEYIEHLLTEANLTKTVTPAQQALTLIGELADIFHQAEEASR